MTSAGDMTDPGFWGKLPREPEFVSRGLPASFSEPWDAWLQEVLAGSRELLGEAWLDAYMVCPIVHFVIGPGVFGDRPWLGALMPSVDRVGRYFPLTVAQSLPAEGVAALMPLFSKGVDERWFAPVQDAMLGVLGAEGYGADGLAEALCAADFSSVHAACHASDMTAASVGSDPELVRWSWSEDSGLDATDVLMQLRVSALEAKYAPTSAWVSHATANRDGELVVLRGLPNPKVFAALLTGSSSAPVLEYVEAPRCDETLPPNGGKPDEVIDDTIPESYVLRKAESELDLREAELREFLDGKLGGSPP